MEWRVTLALLFLAIIAPQITGVSVPHMLHNPGMNYVPKDTDMSFATRGRTLRDAQAAFIDTIARRETARRQFIPPHAAQDPWSFAQSSPNTQDTEPAVAAAQTIPTTSTTPTTPTTPTKETMFLIQLKPPMTSILVEHVLRCVGDVIWTYYPHYAMLVLGTDAQALRAHHHCAAVVDVLPFEPYNHVWEDEQASPPTEIVVHCLRERCAGLVEAVGELAGVRETLALGREMVMARLDPRMVTTETVDAMCLMPGVTGVARATGGPVEMLNKYARWTIQSGVADYSPLSEMGLAGEGQVLGVADTSVDVHSCYFWDPFHPVPYQYSGNETESPAAHRKFVSYHGPEYEDTVPFSHGTHTLATAVGAALSTTASAEALAAASEFNGMAPESRVVFHALDDVLSQTLSEGRSSVQVVGALDFATILEQQWDEGARVSMNAWSTPASVGEAGTYSELSRLVDEFVWNHQDFLVVFGAGNNDASNPMSVRPPSTNKNGLSVGASQSSKQSWEAALSTEAVQLQWDPEHGTAETAVPAVPGSFGVAVPHPDGIVAPGVVVAPELACDTLENGPSLEGAIAVVRRGDCRFVDKADRVQQAGALALIVVNYENSVVNMAGNADIRIPVVMVDASAGDVLIADIYASSSLELRLLPGNAFVSVADDPYFSIHNMAPFSAAGPTSDGRYKPDVYAPGYKVFSALAGASSCDHTARYSQEGTSMATAVMAGSSLLLREYFAKGWFTPLGTHSPSAALLKAVIIGSAVPLEVVTDTTDDQALEPLLERTPSFRQGFGRAVLANAVPVPREQVATEHASLAHRFDLWAIDKDLVRGIIDTSLQIRTFCFQIADPGKPFTVTLVWNDPPLVSTGDHTLSRLINDLDLAVTCDSFAGDILLGNGRIQASTQSIRWTADHVNNVERVVIPNPVRGDTCQVSVFGARISHGPQLFALTVTGRMLEVDREVCTNVLATSPGCETGCSGRGTCVDSIVCVCNTPYFGQDCGNSPTLLSLASPVITDDVSPASWLYYAFVPPPNFASLGSVGVIVEFRRLSSTGDPDFFVRRNALPTLLAYDYVDAGDDTLTDYHVVSIQASELASGNIFYFGVHGHDASAIATGVRLAEDDPLLASPAQRAHPMPYALLLLLVLVPLSLSSLVF